MREAIALTVAAVMAAGINSNAFAAALWPADAEGNQASPCRLVHGHTVAPAEGAYSMIKHPSTLLGLFANLKFALDRDLLLEEDLYTEDTLRTFSGGAHILWLHQNPTRQWASITGFGRLLKPVRVGNNTFEGIFYSIRRDVLAHGECQAGAHVSFMESHPELSFENIQRIFGKDWQSFPYFPPPHGMIFKPPTDPHGNDRIRYVIDGGRVRRTIVAEFLADGTLYNMSISEETK